jgi:hypothetical protein
MLTNTKNWATSVIDMTGGGDEKIHSIVNEVEQFLKSVHADIEDWKFAMEDYGDGTRIFIRLQIHINKSLVPLDRTRPDDEKPVVRLEPDHVDGQTPPGTPGPPTDREVAEDLQESGPVARKRRVEDLASFVDVWRNKRESNLDGEFHKEGAPYVDGHSEWKGEKRSSDDASPVHAKERAHEGSKKRKTLR